MPANYTINRPKGLHLRATAAAYRAIASSANALFFPLLEQVLTASSHCWRVCLRQAAGRLPAPAHAVSAALRFGEHMPEAAIHHTALGLHPVECKQIAGRDLCLS